MVPRRSSVMEMASMVPSPASPRKLASEIYSVNNSLPSVDLNIEPLSDAQVQQRIKKGLKIDDRFTELIRSNPSKLQQIYDHHTTSKIPMDVETTGKPN